MELRFLVAKMHFQDFGAGEVDQLIYSVNTETYGLSAASLD